MQMVCVAQDLTVYVVTPHTLNPSPVSLFNSFQNQQCPSVAGL